MTTTQTMMVRLDETLAEDFLSERVKELLNEHALAIATELRATLIGFGTIIVTDYVNNTYEYPL